MKTRREFLKVAAIGAAAFPAGGAALRSAPAAAAVPDGMPRLELDDPAAVALGYVHDVADVDTSRFPRYEEGQLCSNCRLISGPEEDDWRPCSIFPGKLVANEGWCSAWVAKG
ncbi:MAG: High potential iron-sulfur protein [Gammaproteobacteria bacterium]|nr:MAG: High potential iron-sulfur protein [Gammaproteobacteria bacterium]